MSYFNCDVLYEKFQIIKPYTYCQRSELPKDIEKELKSIIDAAPYHDLFLKSIHPSEPGTVGTLLAGCYVPDNRVCECDCEGIGEFPDCQPLNFRTDNHVCDIEYEVPSSLPLNFSTDNNVYDTE